MNHEYPLHILLTGASGAIGKYIMRHLQQTGFVETPDPADSESNRPTLTTLGQSDGDHIRGDLRHAVPPIPKGINTVIHCAGANPDSPNEILEIRGLGNLLDGVTEAGNVKNFVFISTVEVYGKQDGCGYNELTPTQPVTEFGRMKLEAENILVERCKKHGINLSIIRCAPVVCTGMHNPIRRLAADIYRGSYRHIADNDARTSVVHAVDVARAAVDIIGHEGIFNLTDGVDPSRHDLAEALSWRMGNKRIFTLPLSKARKLARINDWLPFTRFDSEMLKRETTSLTFSSEKIHGILGWRPNSVTEYLRTHVYDENSL